MIRNLKHVERSSQSGSIQLCVYIGGREVGGEEAERRFRQAEVVTSHESIEQNLTKSSYR